MAIIQARLTSTRFPNKILQKLGEKTILQHVIDNVSESKFVDKVVVAAPHKIPDHDVEVYTSREEDYVLQRYFLSARYNKADIIVRITSDCPLIDPFWIDYCINVLEWKNYDYVCNTPFCPDGLDVEVFTFDALEKSYMYSVSKPDFEHVTPWIRRNMKMAEISGVLKYDNVKLSIDTPEDLERVRRLVCSKTK